MRRQIRADRQWQFSGVATSRYEEKSPVRFPWFHAGRVNTHGFLAANAFGFLRWMPYRTSADGRGRGSRNAIANSADAALSACAATVPRLRLLPLRPLKLLAYTGVLYGMLDGRPSVRVLVSSKTGSVQFSSILRA